MSRFDIHINRNLIGACHDTIMAGLSFLLAVYLRLGDDDFHQAEHYLVTGTVMFTLVCVVCFFSVRLYRGLWRYASMRDMIAIVRAVSLSVIVFAAMMFLVNRLDGLPRSVLFINWMLLLLMLGAPRFLYRAIKDKSLTWKMSMEDERKIPVVLIGAGYSAEQFIRDLSRNRSSAYEVVAIADDTPANKGHTIHGVPIYGGTDILPTIARKLKRKGKAPQKLILADDNIDGERVAELLSIADRLGIPLARLPKLSEFKQGTQDKAQIRSIAVEDLLGRAQNVLNRDSMQALVAGKRALITGCGGTIGGELTRQIASYNPSELLLVELSEFNLYQIEREIRAAFPELPLRMILCDVRDAKHIEAIFSQHKPQLVFHAAAIKHVPMAEFNIEETILTNVMGTRHVANACLAYNTEAMVMISTDKAVNPTNVMGASKRLAESYCQALGRGEKAAATRFITVRFGNVLGSTGSVVPLFQEQLAKGGPLTVTHPDMTRYFMTVREAVELVLQAAALGMGLEQPESIFVLDMGKPVKIHDLALKMIRLAGLREGVDIQIEYTGLRPGEKLFEELFHFSENTAKTSHESIFLASPRSSDLDELSPKLDALLAACTHRQAAKALAMLKELVPEFQHAE